MSANGTDADPSMAAAGINLRLLTVLVLIAIFSLALLLSSNLQEWRAEQKCGREHVFRVSSPQPFLSDDLALAQARAALHVQGFNTNRWRPAGHSRTRAPDGTNDRYLSRNVVNDNLGIVTFVNNDGKFRGVHLRLTNDTVLCVVQPAQAPR